MLPIIDSHQHFWDLAANDHPWLRGQRIPFRYGDYGAICRNYLPDDYRADTRGFSVVGTVHMEAEIAHADAVGETLWLERLAVQEGLPWACVAQARLDAPDAEDILAQQGSRPMVRGIRHKPAAAASPGQVERGAAGGMDDPAWRRGYAALHHYGLSFDLQAPWWHTGQVAALAGDFPDTALIVNHTFLPADRSPEGLAGWRDAVAHVARRPNVAMKISGLGLAGREWRAAENVQLIREAIAIMGWERCMFASNFPVDGLVATFGQVAGAFLEAIAGLPLAQQAALLHDNAVRIYRLDTKPTATGAEQPLFPGSDP